MNERVRGQFRTLDNSDHPTQTLPTQTPPIQTPPDSDPPIQNPPVLDPSFSDLWTTQTLGQFRPLGDSNPPIQAPPDSDPLFIPLTNHTLPDSDPPPNSDPSQLRPSSRADPPYIDPLTTLTPGKFKLRPS